MIHMKKIGSILLLLLCNILWLHAQEDKLSQIEKSLENIRTDLQQKKLQYSWSLMSEYLDYCSTTHKLLSPKNEPKLSYIVYELKPAALNAPKEAYETARDELKKMMSQYPEYVELDSLYQRTSDKDKRKEISTAMSNFYRRLADENKDYRPMRDKEQRALRNYHIAAARYMLEESKKNQEVVPSSFITYAERNNILSSNADLNQLSVEIRLLEDLQKEALQEYQRLKYQIDLPQK